VGSSKGDANGRGVGWAQVKNYNLDGQKLNTLDDDDETQMTITSVAYSSDGKFLVGGTGKYKEEQINNTLRIIDIRRSPSSLECSNR
jgi:hypothetical protein